MSHMGEGAYWAMLRGFVTPGSALRVIPGRFEGPYEMVETEFRSSACKVDVLSPVLLLRPSSFCSTETELSWLPSPALFPKPW